MALTIEVVGEGYITEVTRWESVAKLSAGGQFSFSMPATGDGAELVEALAVVRCMWRGNVVAAGIVSRFGIAAGVLQVQGEDMARELATVIINDTLEDGGAAMSLYDAVEWIGDALPGGWTLVNDVDPGNTATIYLEAVNDSLLAVLGTVCSLGSCWYVISGTELTVSDTLGAVRHNVTLLDLAKSVDAADIVNKIHLYGAGDGEAAFDLGAATDSAPSGYTVDEAASTIEWDDSPYALRERAVTLGWIGPLEASDAGVEAAANMLLQGGLAWLQRYATPVESYTARVAYSDVISPLERVALHWKGPGLLVNAEPAVVEARLEIEPDRLLTTSLTLEADGRKLPTDAEVLADAMLTANRARMWPQLELASDDVEGEGLIDESTNLDAVLAWPARVVQVKSAELELAYSASHDVILPPGSIQWRLNGTGSWTTYSAPVDIYSSVVDTPSRRPLASSFTVNVRGVAPSEVIPDIGGTVSGWGSPTAGTPIKLLRAWHFNSQGATRAQMSAGTYLKQILPAGTVVTSLGTSFSNIASFYSTDTGRWMEVDFEGETGWVLAVQYAPGTSIVSWFWDTWSTRSLTTAFFQADARARASIRASALAQ